MNRESDDNPFINLNGAEVETCNFKEPDDHKQ